MALAEVPGADAAEAVGCRLGDAARRIGLTVSVGVAVADRDEPAAAVLNRADAALYAAKRAGRDAVHVADAGDVSEPATWV